MRFFIEKKIKGALGRAGVLETAHGTIHTPAFVPVGTKATVKALTPAHLKNSGAEIVLGNAYHLYLEPGEKIIAAAGGLGKFMGWDGPTMTDSGGFQVFSLGGRGTSKITTQRQHSDILQNVRMFSEEKDSAPLVKIDEDGVTFKSYRDGSEHRFTPERSIEIQRALGADIIFAFDECVSPSASYEYQKEAMERTHAWALRSLKHHQKSCGSQASTIEAWLPQKQMLFGIVQGGRHKDLRKESAKAIGEMRIEGLAPHSGPAEFAGFGIGGSFEKEDMGNAVRWVNEILPEEKPRHLLGIGGVADLFSAVENGCDLFDCVAPTREARTGALYTKHGRLNITNTRFRTDFSLLEEGCPCYTCLNFTKAYLAHLFRSQELLAYSLATIHNLSFFIGLVKNMREAILEGRFAECKKDFLLHYKLYLWDS
jgi:queuine tRNA-ribosyltransferase